MQSRANEKLQFSTFGQTWARCKYSHGIMFTSIFILKEFWWYQKIMTFTFWNCIKKCFKYTYISWLRQAWAKQQPVFHLRPYGFYNLAHWTLRKHRTDPIWRVNIISVKVKTWHKIPTTDFNVSYGNTQCKVFCMERNTSRFFHSSALQTCMFCVA